MTNNTTFQQTEENTTIPVSETPVLRSFGASTRSTASNQRKWKFDSHSKSHIGAAVVVLSVVTAIAAGSAWNAYSLKKNLPPSPALTEQTNVTQTPLAATPAQAPIVAAVGQPPANPEITEAKNTPPQSMEEALQKIKQLETELASAQKQLEEARVQLEKSDKSRPNEDNQEETVAMVAEPKPINRKTTYQVKKSPILQSEPILPDYVTLSILEIKAESILIADVSKPNVKISVTPGAMLPGGATFIGFDPSSRLLKTDQGDFPIP